MKKPRQGRHILTELKLFVSWFYKDAAPTALVEMAWLFVKRIHQQTKQVNSNDHNNQLHYCA